MGSAWEADDEVSPSEPLPPTAGDPPPPPRKGFFGSPVGRAIRNFVTMFITVLAFVQALVFLLGEGDEVKSFLLTHHKTTLIVMGYAIVAYALYVWLEEPDL